MSRPGPWDSPLRAVQVLEARLGAALEERRRSCRCESCCANPDAYCVCESCEAAFPLELSQDDLDVLLDALHARRHKEDHEARALRHRADLARAREVYRDTKNAARALAVLGITGGREGQGRRDGPSDAYLADLYVRLQTEAVSETIDRMVKVSKLLELQAEMVVKTARFGAGRAYSEPPGMTEPFRLDRAAPMDDESALRNLARYAGVGRRTMWDRLNAERRRRVAAGESSFTLPSSREPRLGSVAAKKRRNIATPRAR